MLINGRFLSGQITAVNSVAKELSIALHQASLRQDNGWSVELVVPRALESKAWSLGIPVRSHGRLSGIFWEQLELPKLRRDGVVLSLFNTVPIFGRGYTTMLHDANVMKTPESYGRLTRRWRKFLSWRAGNSGNHILTISEYSLMSLLDCGIGHPEMFGIVPNGLGQVGRVQADIGIFTRLGLRYGVPYCVGLSSLLPHKNIEVLLKSFARPALAGVDLVLFGNATADDFRELGHPVSSNVHFAGFVTDEELAALYRGALAVCMPSREEGFGLPALEGMAHGAVALVAPNGSLPEVVADAGVYAHPDDPDEWVEQILKLKCDRALTQSLRCAGRKRAAEYTWDASAERTFELLERWY
ncbi:glycosyltransferase family 4 protein [Donghicola mangrovi]|uniref:Glycosyltransferase family 4 protein n=1 Tax=Donghicola mangrovi TaxID=2729614 RepID=A0A850QAA2_9RHOB|nr:glycosyltransferase family 1 protein [Donghicola mangrovi]NVO25212.1 glycosyltransferase family 4 protein [Donghicola mangrovi]